jgi:hypothetical protein
MDSASSSTLQLGWAASADAVEAADDDGFITSTDSHTASFVKMMSSLARSAVPGKFKRFASPVQVQVKAGVGGDTATGTVRAGVWYIID